MSRPPYITFSLTSPQPSLLHHQSQPPSFHHHDPSTAPSTTILSRNHLPSTTRDLKPPTTYTSKKPLHNHPSVHLRHTQPPPSRPPYPITINSQLPPSTNLSSTTHPRPTFKTIPDHHELPAATLVSPSKPPSSPTPLPLSPTTHLLHITHTTRLPSSNPYPLQTLTYPTINHRVLIFGAF
ncbi:hypothetical protein RND81_13G054400 [Saponaria officinalis]|uniref:Uncharacterized protein n=1 Tax=Saponaria officinalis TaxID=3572 RepID=A0AAW1GUB0_SAPOF